MAVIHCPECGNEVSDQAKKCPHCGVSVFVCPECGEVSIGEEKCPNCGFSTVSPKAVAADSTKERGATECAPKNLFERWKESDSQTKNRKKTLSAITYSLQGLQLVLAVIWFFQIFNSYLHVDLESILTLAVNHGSNLDKTDTYFAIIVVLAIVSFVFDSAKEIINAISCAKWIRRDKIDIENDIDLVLAQKKSKAGKKEEETDEDEEEDKGATKSIIDEAKDELNMEDLGAALFLAVDPNQTAFFVFSKLIPQFFWEALSVFAFICLKNNAVSFMNTVLKGDFVDNGNGTFSFSYDYSFDWLPFLIGCVIIIALCVVAMLICNAVRKKKIEKTLQKVQDARSK